MDPTGLAEVRNRGEGASAAPRGGGPHRANSQQRELKGCQEKPERFLKRTLGSTSKRREAAAPEADKSWGRQGHFRTAAFLHSDMCTRMHTHRGCSLAWSPCEPPSFWHPGPTLTCDVVHHHGHCGVPNVAGDQATEPLLACCVPELQSHLLQGRQGGQQGQWGPHGMRGGWREGLAL